MKSILINWLMNLLNLNIILQSAKKKIDDMSRTINHLNNEKEYIDENKFLQENLREKEDELHEMNIKFMKLSKQLEGYERDLEASTGHLEAMKYQQLMVQDQMVLAAKKKVEDVQLQLVTVNEDYSKSVTQVAVLKKVIAEQTQETEDLQGKHEAIIHQMELQAEEWETELEEKQEKIHELEERLKNELFNSANLRTDLDKKSR